ncbi:MAG: hydroxyphenylacetyl-CoA thioesterase PaaI [Nocardioides sp.]
MTQAQDPAGLVWSRAMALYTHDRTCQGLGIVVADIAPGWARLEMHVDDAMVNSHGTAHGGYLFLLADAAFAYAANSHGPVAVAQSAHTAFLRPAVPGDLLVAEAEERARIGLTGIYDVTVRRPADETVIAEFRGHSVVLPGRRPAEPTEPTEPTATADRRRSPEESGEHTHG